MSQLGLVILLQKNGWVDKYLVKRNSYQPLSAAVSIWLPRTSRSWKKNKTFHISSATHNSLSKVEVKYSDEAGAATAVKCGVSCEAVSFMHEPNPHTSQSLCHRIRRHLEALKALVHILLSHLDFRC